MHASGRTSHTHPASSRRESTRRPALSWAVVVGAGLAGAIAAPAFSQMGSAGDDGIAREAIGERAERLKDMELEPFPASLWHAVSNNPDIWLGEALKPSDIDGKVVLIGSWASWNATSTRALAAMNRLAEQHAGDGLVVLGLHHPTGWEQAPARAARMSFPNVHDAEGVWREKLEIDQDPDFYLIDRAGQLRYADVHTASLSKAVDTLLAETVSEAAGLKDRLLSAAEQREREFRRTRAIAREAEATELPAVSFVPPSPEEYSEVDWPESPEMRGDDRNRRDSQEWVPSQFSYPPEMLFPANPPNTNGKLTVVYFWNHELRGRGREFMREFLPQVDLLGRRYGRDVKFIGLLTQFEQRDNRRRDNDEDDWKPEELKSVVENYYKTHDLKHHLLIDDIDASLQQLLRTPATQNSRGGREEYPWPYAAIVSSDGLIRWGGYVGPEFRQTNEVAGYDDFILALQRMIDRDPGVKARREAEEAYIRGLNGGR